MLRVANCEVSAIPCTFVVSIRWSSMDADESYIPFTENDKSAEFPRTHIESPSEIANLCVSIAFAAGTGTS